MPTNLRGIIATQWSKISVSDFSVSYRSLANMCYYFHNDVNAAISQQSPSIYMTPGAAHHDYDASSQRSATFHFDAATAAYTPIQSYTTLTLGQQLHRGKIIPRRILFRPR